MSRSAQFVIALGLAVLLVGAGIYFYEQAQRPSLEVKVDNNGIKITGNGN